MDPDSPGGFIRRLRTWVRIVRVWCPDIPDESPDIPNGAMQNSRPFDVIYALCILSWLIILGNQDIGTKSNMVECRMAAPPNPPDLAQAIAAMLTRRDE